MQALDLDDAYVPERLLAACYGVAMAHQRQDPMFEGALVDLLAGLQQRLLGLAATNPTNHWLARKYTRGLFAIAAQFYPAVLPAGVDPQGLGFADAPEPPPLREGDADHTEARTTLRMDFENYTIGRLVQGRRNYEMDHPEFKEVVASVLGRVWQLGWRADEFERLDRSISQEDWRPDHNSGRVERYGKKYGWIGYYEAAGRLKAQGALNSDEFGRAPLPDVDIDPSFPEPPPPAPVRVPSWVRTRPKRDRRWLETAAIRVPAALLRRQRLDNARGPWVAASGYLRAHDEEAGRNVFGFLTGLLVAPDELPRLQGS